MDEGQVIARLRERAGLTIREAAARVGWSHSKWHSKENGSTKLKENEIEQIATALGVSEGEVASATGRALQKLIPLLDIARAGKLVFESELQEGVDPRYADEFVSGTEIASRNAFALRIKGDSMSPTIANGAVVICEPLIDYDEGELRDGLVVVAWVAPRKKEKAGPWQGGGIIGRWFYIRDQNKAELRKDNPAHPTATLDLSYEATPRIAKVIEVRTRL